MLTDEMRAAGWLDHTAGPCPVPLDSRVSVMLRGGIIWDDRPAGLYALWPYDWWKHEALDHDYDIIAFLPETAQ